MIDLISGLFLIAGGFFAMIAGLGILRFPDLLTRMHAATKAAGAALGLGVTAMVIRMPSWDMALKAIVCLLLAFMTLPVGAHLLGRNASQDDDAA